MMIAVERLGSFAARTAAAMVGIWLAGCAPTVLERGSALVEPSLEGDTFIVEDGAQLRVRSWLPDGAPKAVVITVHGINDRSKAFDSPAGAWRSDGTAVYAFDQRGFAQSPGRGYWPGRDNLAADLALFARLLRERHPDIPQYVLGESMGGGVVLFALASGALEGVRGAVLVAPAAVTWQRLPVYWRAPLWLLAHTIPWYPASNEGMNLRPTDNMEAWREMSFDPDTIVRPRIDVLYGLTQLMDAAARGADRVDVPMLVLYGRQDQFVRDWMFADLERRLEKKSAEYQFYEDGYHWLLRDHGAEAVYAHILAWINAQSAGPRRRLATLPE